MEKLDWLPLYIDNLLSSPAWQDMKDFQRGWYIQLLLRSTRSERLGYLPVTERLWELSGAHRREMWETHKSAVMACFRTRTFDDLDWIYNPKLLSVMEDQSNKYRRRSSLISPVLSDVDSGKSTSKAKPNSIDEVVRYCRDIGVVIDVDRWWDHYQSNGWMVGRAKLKDWKAAVRNWSRNDNGFSGVKNAPTSKATERVIKGRQAIIDGLSLGVQPGSDGAVVQDGTPSGGSENLGLMLRRGTSANG